MAIMQAIGSRVTGAQAMTDFCEQVDPRVLRTLRDRDEDVRHTRTASDMVRVQESWLAGIEKRALLWLAVRTPEWIGPDHLTVLGLVAQIGAGAAYAWARWNRYALLLAIVCMALNWLGDSLDGTLARVRRQERPRYGFYVDHMVDILGAVALMCGLGASGLLHWPAAMAMLVAFLVLSSESYLATYTLACFQL